MLPKSPWGTRCASLPLRNIVLKIPKKRVYVQADMTESEVKRYRT